MEQNPYRSSCAGTVDGPGLGMKLQNSLVHGKVEAWVSVALLVTKDVGGVELYCMDLRCCVGWAKGGMSDAVLIVVKVSARVACLREDSRTHIALAKVCNHQEMRLSMSKHGQEYAEVYRSSVRWIAKETSLEQIDADH